jgi:hypothetical protein
VRGVVLIALALLTPASLAHAGGLEAYLQKHGLPSRVVLSARTIPRVFVPVTRGTEEDFLSSFGPANGAFVLRPFPANRDHPYLILGRDRAYSFHGRRFDPSVEADHFGKQPLRVLAPPPIGSHYVTASLTAPELEGLEDWLENTFLANRRPRECDRGGCMWWLLHARTGRDRELAHVLGVTRAGASSNLVRKLIHAGNERVSVIGIEGSAEDLQRWTEAELLGPPPAGGVAEAIKR